MVSGRAGSKRSMLVLELQKLFIGGLAPFVSTSGCQFGDFRDFQDVLGLALLRDSQESRCELPG